MQWSKLPILASLTLVLATAVGHADDAGSNSLPIIPTFELRDQYDLQHKVSFPTTNVTVLTIADRKGAEQIDGWVATVKEHYAGRVGIAGIADLSKVPGPLRSLVQSKFKRRYSYPVMMDWGGAVAGRFHCPKDQANALVIDRQGHLTTHLIGTPTPDSRKTLFDAIDLALANPQR